MTARDAVLKIRNFLGLNRRDGSDKVLDNQFYRIQNFYQPVRGLFYKTPGTTEDFAFTKTASVTIASPGVFTVSLHGLAIGDPVSFTTTGALPTGLTASTVYYVKTVPTTSTFTVAATLGGAAINTSGTQSGVHTAVLVPGVSKITGIHRHYAQGGQRSTIYHCEPDATKLADPVVGQDLTLTEIDGGDLFNGRTFTSASDKQMLRFCYSGFGWNQETPYNTINNGSYDPTPGTDAWDQDHQTIMPSAANKGIRVTAPSFFGMGWQGINVFMSRGSFADDPAECTQMTYVGSIYEPGGTLDVVSYIHDDTDASSDTFTGVEAEASDEEFGELLPGTYYVALAWLVSPSFGEGAIPVSVVPIKLGSVIAVRLSQLENAINVTGPSGASSNGATDAYIFVGTQDPLIAPMTCVGIVRDSGTVTIRSIPKTNAQSHSNPDVLGEARFANWVNSGFIASDAVGRQAVLISKDSSGDLSQIHMSRSIFLVTGTTNPHTGSDEGGFVGYGGGPATPVNPPSLAQGRLVEIEEPRFCYFRGLSYFVNGYDIPWLTDGNVLGQIVREAGATEPDDTVIPESLRYITVFENCLIGVSKNYSVLFASNAYNPINWSEGGTGPDLKFMETGDPFTGSPLTALGVFSFSTDAINDPRSFLVAFKKNACWMKDSFPDSVSGVGAPMEQLSARIGSIAHMSLTQTPIGLCFVGSDGDVYLIRGSGEPKPIGTKSVKTLLEHLSENDDLMKLVSATYHDNHLKISYPSSSSSITNDAQIWCDMRVAEGEGILWSGPHLGVSIAKHITLIGEGDDQSRLGIKAGGLGTLVLDDTSTFKHLGTDQVSVLEWKNSRMGSTSHLKKFVGMILDLYYDTQFTHDISLNMYSDSYSAVIAKSLSSPGTPAEWDVSNWDSDYWSDAQFNGVPMMLGPEVALTGRTLRWTLTHSNDAQLIVAGADILFRPEKRRIA